MEVGRLRCCIITKQSDSSFLQCTRMAFKPLTKELIDTIVKKHLPLYFDSANKHRLVLCLSHRRMVQNVGRFNDSYHKLNLSNYDISEQRELQEFMDEFFSHCRKRLVDDGICASAASSSSTNVANTTDALEERFENLYERYRSYDHIYDPISPSKRNTSSENPDSSKDSDGKTTDDSKIPFGLLSAMALRRYKKFFKLPNRSGASSKPQLLEGLHEHVESIPIDQAETAAFFMYTLRNRKNQLDFPNGSEISSSKKL